MFLSPAPPRISTLSPVSHLRPLPSSEGLKSAAEEGDHCIRSGCLVQFGFVEIFLLAGGVPRLFLFDRALFRVGVGRIKLLLRGVVLLFPTTVVQYFLLSRDGTSGCERWLFPQRAVTVQSRKSSYLLALLQVTIWSPIPPVALGGGTYPIGPALGPRICSPSPTPSLLLSLVGGCRAGSFVGASISPSMLMLMEQLRKGPVARGVLSRDPGHGTKL
jgi:hypothetical protein